MKTALGAGEKGTDGWIGGQGAVGNDAEPLVTTQAEGLPAVAGAAIGGVAAGVDGMTTDVIASVQIEGPDDAVVARLAKRLLVTGGAIVGVVLCGLPVVAFEVGAVGVSAHEARGRKLAG